LAVATRNDQFKALETLDACQSLAIYEFVAKKGVFTARKGRTIRWIVPWKGDNEDQVLEAFAFCLEMEVSSLWSQYLSTSQVVRVLKVVFPATINTYEGRKGFVWQGI
jgi:hypothetical protein